MQSRALLWPCKVRMPIRDVHAARPSRQLHICLLLIKELFVTLNRILVLKSPESEVSLYQGQCTTLLFVFHFYLLFLFLPPVYKIDH